MLDLREEKPEKIISGQMCKLCRVFLSSLAAVVQRLHRLGKWTMSYSNQGGKVWFDFGSKSDLQITGWNNSVNALIEVDLLIKNNCWLFVVSCYGSKVEGWHCCQKYDQDQ